MLRFEREGAAVWDISVPRDGVLFELAGSWAGADRKPGSVQALNRTPDTTALSRAVSSMFFCIKESYLN